MRGQKRQHLTLSELQNGERAIISVEELSDLVGISLGSARKAVRAGEIPSLRLGARWLIPVPKLLQMLGAQDNAERD